MWFNRTVIEGQCFLEFPVAQEYHLPDVCPGNAGSSNLEIIQKVSYTLCGYGENRNRTECEEKYIS